MTVMPVRRPRRERPLRQVFAAPLLVAVVSIVGLVAALLGDGWLDVAAWIGLGIPSALSLWYLYR